MHFASFAVLALLATVPTNAFIAWSGDACNGAQGATVACDGTCFSFSGRHSFRAGTPGASHCVALFVNSGCSGQRFNFTNQQNQCTNVNTGTAINSFRCFRGAGCA
ncbi:hypothetical protein AURDEDRAFT_176296 [Auricularia subglabra TFB-10046 SS5]|uniref:Uncharacterized protein n=1 Tax=Auricularia subglabra (strain TFB-10046 / SS5) TaxID=717982 RepID=J0D6W0_AURST|nr:hypothetical protein AURDEDRAFT_176296 [Auricularia subglabra TFB-10046 SS5]